MPALPTQARCQASVWTPFPYLHNGDSGKSIPGRQGRAALRPSEVRPVSL